MLGFGVFHDLTFLFQVSFFCSGLLIRSLSFSIPGLSSQLQEAELRTRPEIVVATPGRMLDLLRNAASVSYYIFIYSYKREELYT